MAYSQPLSKSKCKFVAAIDLGTAYSGYAFSSRKNWQDVHTNSWKGSNLISAKESSALLLNPDASFKSFGFSAENHYTILCGDGEDKCKDYYYFRNFKRAFHQEWDKNKRIGRGTMIKDNGGKSLEAIIVFSLSIEYLLKHLYGRVKKFRNGNMTNIEFVLMVPSVWDHSARALMREAGVTAGIPNDQLSIISEPEAALIYFQHIPNEVLRLEYGGNLRTLKTGELFMVLDCGDTTKITIYRRCEDVTEELYTATQSPLGGKSINEAYENILQDIVGETVMRTFKENALEDYVWLFGNFESKKRFRDYKNYVKESYKILGVPSRFYDFIKGKEKGFEKAIQESKYSDSISLQTGKLKWKTEDFVNVLFDDTINEIVVTLLKDDIVKDVKTILMVGGFSECELFQIAIKDKFPDKKVIVPTECELAVLKGAVYSGHVGNVNSHFYTTYTYGVKSWPVWKEMNHPLEKRVQIRDTYRCRDGFFKYVIKGQSIKPGYKRSQTFTIHLTDQTLSELECPIFISERKYPMLTDEPTSRELGVLKLDLSHVPQGAVVEFEETMIFEETRIRFQVGVIKTHQIQEVSFNVLDV